VNACDSSAFVLPDFVRMRDFAIRDVRATQYRFRARRLAPIRSTPAVALVLPVRAGDASAQAGSAARSGIR